MTDGPGDALDILANAVSKLEEIDKARTPVVASEHRVSCHRCGNIRKKKLCCPRPDCPHIFCGRCADKLRIEHGEDVFTGGCPVCKELCCCSNKTIYCDRKNHCYRKCPSTKSKLFSTAHNPPLPSHPSSDTIMTSMSGGDAWDQEAKNCRAPALDFLASIVTNTGPETAAPSPPVIGIPGAIGVGLGGVIASNGHGLTIKKSESGKSLASQSSMSSSTEGKTPTDSDLINANGKRTPVDCKEESQQKQMKIEGRDPFQTPALGETATAVPSSLISNLPMPAGQIPHMNNNGQFNQTMAVDEAARARLADNNSNAEKFVLQNPAANAPDAQMYYFADMKGSTQQQSLVYPVSTFANSTPGVNAVDTMTEGEAVQTGVM